MIFDMFIFLKDRLTFANVDHVLKTFANQNTKLDNYEDVPLCRKVISTDVI